MVILILFFLSMHTFNFCMETDDSSSITESEFEIDALSSETETETETYLEKIKHKKRKHSVFEQDDEKYSVRCLVQGCNHVGFVTNQYGNKEWMKTHLALSHYEQVLKDQHPDLKEQLSNNIKNRDFRCPCNNKKKFKRRGLLLKHFASHLDISDLKGSIEKNTKPPKYKRYVVFQCPDNCPEKFYTSGKEKDCAARHMKTHHPKFRYKNIEDFLTYKIAEFSLVQQLKNRQ